MLLWSQFDDLYTALFNALECVNELCTGFFNLPLTGINGCLTQDILIFRAKSIPQTLAYAKDQRIIHVMPERQVFLVGTIGACGIKYREDRKSTRLNSSHVAISYAVFCL